MCLDEQADVALVRRVINEGYASDLADHEVEKIGRDPFLVSYALRSLAARRVVTTEVSRPRNLQVSCMDSFGLVKVMNFSTSWKTQAGK